MNDPTPASAAARAALARHRTEIGQVLLRYHATNAHLFGSVARGDATEGSDLDLLVDLLPDAGNPLLRVTGLGEELSALLGRRVDVVTSSLLREAVSHTALRDAVRV